MNSIKKENFFNYIEKAKINWSKNPQKALRFTKKATE